MIRPRYRPTWRDHAAAAGWATLAAASIGSYLCRWLNERAAAKARARDNE